MELRLAQWVQALKERASTGESIKDFCQNKGISRHTYFYWQKKVRDVACGQLIESQTKAVLPAPGFKEIRLPEIASPATIVSDCLCFETNGYRITAGSAYPAEALADLLRKLVQPC
jgi:transposase-like protein